jgi:flagellar motor switch protein FliN
MVEAPALPDLAAVEEKDIAASGQPDPIAAPNLNTILSIPVIVQVVLGSTSLPVASLMKLARGAVISLDQRVGDIVVVDETSQRFGVSLLEIVAGSGLERAA